MPHNNFSTGSRRHPDVQVPERFEVRISHTRVIEARRWQFPEDASVIEAGLARSEDHLAPWLTWKDADGQRPPQTTWAAVAKRVTDEYAAVLWWETAAWFNWLLFDKQTGTFLGVVDLGQKDDGRWVTGTWTTADSEARRIATHVKSEVVQLAFSVFDAPSVTMEINSNNGRPERVARSLGFKPSEPIPCESVTPERADSYREWTATPETFVPAQALEL